MVNLYPIVKVNQPSLKSVHLGLPLRSIVVKLQDLLTSSGKTFNKTFYEIKKAGNIQVHQKFNKYVILSTIMRDDLIAKVPFHMYVLAINTLKPNSCLTPDAETYESTTYRKNNKIYYDGKDVAREEIKRISAATLALKEIFPSQHFIGLVKGSGKEMIEQHARFLVSNGIDDLAFHIGDFMRFGIKENILRGKLYASSIKKIGKSLILHGMGCQSRLIEFSFADAFITYAHFVAARHGLKYNGTKKNPIKGGYSVNLVRNNLLELLKNIDNIRFQRKIEEVESIWDKASVIEGLLTPQVQAQVAAIQQ